MKPRVRIWLDADVLRAVHEEQLAEHGGASGTRDEGLFDSALARPQNLLAYGNPDAAATPALVMAAAIASSRVTNGKLRRNASSR